MHGQDDQGSPSAPHRRGFFQALAGAGSGLLAGLAGLKVLSTKEVQAAPVPPPLTDSTGNVLVRMQKDLEQTIASGHTPSWLMVVDTRKCIGCNACSVACRAENPTGPAGNFRRVAKLELSLGVVQWAIFKPFNCLQCDNPPCQQAVPPEMIRKRPDGIVEFDLAKLKGAYARAAADACPVGAIHIDDGATFTQNTPAPQDYEARPFVEYGNTYSRKPGANPLADTARKCTFCSHLLEAGVLPACVTTCLGGAMYFGDANNPGSLINEITQGRRNFEGHENLGLKPRVIYFAESMPGAVHIECAGCHY